jgi:hypothetical protein
LPILFVVEISLRFRICLVSKCSFHFFSLSISNLGIKVLEIVQRVIIKNEEKSFSLILVVRLLLGNKVKVFYLKDWNKR